MGLAGCCRSGCCCCWAVAIFSSSAGSTDEWPVRIPTGTVAKEVVECMAAMVNDECRGGRPGARDGVLGEGSSSRRR